MATATLEWSVNVECPRCENLIDLAENDDDNIVGNAIFNNNWDALIGHEVTCSHCGRAFKLEAIEC